MSKIDNSIDVNIVGDIMPVATAPFILPKTRYIAVTEGGKLAFKFDPIRGIIHRRIKGVDYYHDLGEIANEYQRQQCG